MIDILVLFFWFSIKHFIADFPLQTKYQYLHKHDLNHPGGYVHAFIHGVGTIFVLGQTTTLLGNDLAIIATAEMIIHFFIDWSKMNINIKMNWKSDNSEYFWWLLGFDQFLHYLTYIGIIYIVLADKPLLTIHF